jgi:hypothetical protein
MKVRIECFILYGSIFLLALAIGFYSHTLYTWLKTPPEREYCSG